MGQVSIYVTGFVTAADNDLPCTIHPGPGPNFFGEQILVRMFFGVMLTYCL